MDKNLLIITYYFPPLGGVGVQRISKFCKYLPYFGWRPLVVAPQPSAFYSADEEMLDEVRGAALYRVAGLDSFRIREKLVGPLKPRVDSPLRWLARRVSWPDTQTGYIPAAFRFAHRISGKAKAIFVTSPPWSNLILARILKGITNLPLAIDMRDPWTAHPDHDRIRWKRALNRRVERQVLEGADAIIAVTRSHTAYLQRRYPELAERIHYIPNGFDADDFVSKVKPHKKGQLTISYTGILGLANINRGTTLYSSIRRLRDEDGLTPSDLKIEIIGEISALEAERIRRSGVSTFINHLGHLPHRVAMQRLKRADLAWLPYHSEYSKLIVPAKVYEYIGSATPILAVVNPGHETGQLVFETGTGLVVPEGDVDGVTQALRQLIKGRYPYTPKPRAISSFDRRYQTGQLATILDELI